MNTLPKQRRWTGSQDVKGRNIYRGDVVKIVTVPSVASGLGFLGRVYEVVTINPGDWRDEGDYLLVNKNYSNEKFKGKASFIWYGARSCEVIGDIQENPNLLTNL